MDTLGIVFHDVVFGYVVYSRYYFSFSVTLAAEIRDIHLVGAGLRVGIIQDIVVSVALLATGGIGVISQQGLPVDPPHVVGQLLGMTVPAVYRIQVIRMGKSLIIGIDMTRDAAVAVMDRMGKNRGVDIHGNSSSIHGSFQLRVLMTHHTILIGLCPHRVTCEY
jgi:hypothetical protein